MTPAIIAAAFSRIGKLVLHIDANDYYGEEWASFNLDGLQSWINSELPPPPVNTDFSQYLNDSEHFIAVNTKKRCSNVQQTWSCDDDETWNREKLLLNGRKFNLDLSPRVNISPDYKTNENCL